MKKAHLLVLSNRVAIRTDRHRVAVDLRGLSEEEARKRMDAIVARLRGLPCWEVIDVRGGKPLDREDGR